MTGLKTQSSGTCNIRETDMHILPVALVIRAGPGPDLGPVCVCVCARYKCSFVTHVLALLCANVEVEAHH